jgi:competence protein ComEC
VSSFLLYGAVAGFTLGIFSRSLFDFGLSEIVFILVLSLALTVIERRRNKVPSALYLLCASVFLLFFALGALRMECATWKEASPKLEAALNTRIELEGVVIREPEVKEKAMHVYVDSGDERILVIADRSEDVAYGDRITFSGELQKPVSFQTDLGREFNYQGYLRARGVNYTVSFAEVETISSQEGNVLIARLLQFKHAFIERLERAVPQPHASLAQGLLLGVKQALGEKYEEAFQKTGITHIVVLSGYNIMLVMVFIMYVLAFFLPYRLQLVFGFLAIVLFALLVGLSATVVRASIMASLILLAKLTGRTYDVVRALLIAGVAMLLFNPYLLVYDVGFQLSFTATLGLILLSSHIERYVQFMPKFMGVREFLTATVSAQLFVTPLLLYQIGQFSVVSVLVNVLVLPMVPVAMLLSFATGILGFVSFPLSLICGYLASISLSYILEVSAFFASFPLASFAVPAFPFFLVVCAYATLCLLIFFLQKGVKTHDDDELKGWTIIDEEKIVIGEKTALQTLPLFFR